MRSEQEMLDLIVSTAKDDERIRAVIMNGSRADPNAPRDCFQDFDIVYIVTDVSPFRYNYQWIRRFGEIMIMQMPEDMRDPPPCRDGSFIYLMQFTDGNRIDMTIYPLAKLDELGEDSLTVVLLDKDGIVKPMTPNERDYLPQPPSAKAFADCCNEFWWVCPYVAKGLWREEILYAKYILEHSVRDQVMKMSGWYVGLKTGFAGNPGKYGKYLKQYMEPQLWETLERTYSDAGYDSTWEALYAMCDLFRKLALEIAEHFGFDYRIEDDKRVSAHLRHVRRLRRDAKEIY